MCCYVRVVTPADPTADAEVCCDDMRYHLTVHCEQHSDPFECPDVVVVRRGGTYGIPIHDGGTSSIVIRWCPWCGSALD